MNYLSSDVQTKLSYEFKKSHLGLDIQSDHVIVTGPSDLTRKKIQNIIKAAGFSPIVSENKINGNFAFTIIPFVIPNCFLDGENNLLTPTILSDHIKQYYKATNKLLTNNASAYSEHFERNKNNILLAAKDLQGEALILGLGNSDDIPLNQLATQFDKVTVLDIDVESMQKAINNLPLHLQNKIIPVSKDLTGMVSLISEKLASLKDNLSTQKCITETVNIINEVITSSNSEPLSSIKKYNFVVSSMLTSQLFSQMHELIVNLLEEKYSDIKQHLKSSDQISHSTYKFMEHICVVHLKNLSDWVYPDGRVYYVDTTHYHLEALKEEINLEKMSISCRKQRIQTTEALPNETINQKIKEHFISLHNDHWQWHTAEPVIDYSAFLLNCTKPGNVMEVMARVLKPKKHV